MATSRTVQVVAHRPHRRLFAGLVIVGIAAALLGGLAGGLVRAGVAWPAPAVPAPGWLGAATAFHAALMVGGFLGTVIGIERAIALKRRFAFLAPAASAVAGVSLLAGATALAGALLVLAALVFVVANAWLVRRQPALHTGVLLLAALAWLGGSAAFALHHVAGPGTVTSWFAFLVLTIAAERLEMTRLMRRPARVCGLFVALVALLLAGAGASGPWPASGGVLFGGALVAMASWLLAFDIARRTVRTSGLSRYMAICLLAGHAWLAVAGIAWIGMSLAATGLAPAGATTGPLRDLALHALGLGFVLSMVMGHAPVILPAVARVKVRFGPAFYGPLVLLQASLLWRFFASWPEMASRAAGSALNVLAIALFALTMAGGALAWRRAHRPAGTRLRRAGP